MNTSKQKAFTLIELLMVIAIIGILAGILIPVVGLVKQKATIAASKAQLSGYVNAIGLFKGEYNYYPFTEAQEDGGASITDIGVAEFIGTLSARNLDLTRIGSGSGTEHYGNRRLIPFHEFSENDFLNGDSATEQIADKFNNINIYIAIDGDGDGEIIGLPDPDGGETVDIHTKVTAYVLEDADGNPSYYLYQ